MEVDWGKNIGLILAVVAFAYISWYLLFNITSSKKYLYLFLNSGQACYFICDDEDFLEQVVRVIKYCMNNRSYNKRSK